MALPRLTFPSATKLATGVLAGYFVLCGSAADAAAEPFALAVPMAATRPVMSGNVDESWTGAGTMALAYDFTYARAAGDATTVYILQDGSGLDIAFVASAHESLSVAQETNDSGVLNDDSVTVTLYPEGSQGIEYTFSANPRGAHFQTSSENSSYFPHWESAGSTTPAGYVVKMRIPFDAIRSGGATTWRAQFERKVVATNSTTVWEHIPIQRYAEDPVFAGTLADIETGALRPKARLQVYTLGEAAGSGYGASTSRIGADLAVPVTPTSSLIATFHPDYSNVDIDQQTIAPNAFARKYVEVRPFFAQSGSYFNYHAAGNSNTPTTLYTPSIPAFAEGYAYEGTQGPLVFSAFNANGTNRADNGETLTYAVSNPTASFQGSAQRVALQTPFFQEITTTFGTNYALQREHVFAYANVGTDRGTAVTDPRLGDYFEFGTGYATKTTYADIEYQRIGAQFVPADGYVTQSDIIGIFSGFDQTFNFSPSAFLQDIKLNTYFGRYHDHNGNLAQTDGGWQVDFDARQLFTLRFSQGSTGVETPEGQFLPFNTNGFYLGYKSHTSAPTSISFTDGPYYHGYLSALSYVATIPLQRRLRLALEADENSYAPRVAGEPFARQWLERTSIDWQLSRNASFDVGVRRIIGLNMPNAYQTPSVGSAAAPCGTVNGSLPFDCVRATNMSFAFHFLKARNEFYLVYGDANSLVTTPALFVKWIHYIGAPKGT